MGFFDTIYHEEIRCLSGLLLGDLQTKDLGQGSGMYKLYRNGLGTGLLKRIPEKGAEDPFPRAILLSGDHIIRAYTACGECNNKENHPLWCEFNLVFEGGKLTDIRRVSYE